MTRNLSIGLLYETRQTIFYQHGDRPEDILYHWRESEEIEGVAGALESLGHDVTGIDSTAQLLNGRLRDNFHLIWNLSVGALSRNRTALAPALLELTALPYTGADVTTKILCLNKQILKPCLVRHGIQTPEWNVIRDPSEASNAMRFPEFVLKPACEGYSLGVRKFTQSDSIGDVQDCVARLIEDFQVPVLCEQVIPGREITIGLIAGFEQWGAVETVIGDRGSMGADILDVPTKRHGSSRKIPVDTSDTAVRAAWTVANRLMSKFEPLEYASFDFRVSDDGDVYLIDVNADATLHPERSFALGFRYNDISYVRMVQEILRQCLSRWRIQGVDD